MKPDVLKQMGVLEIKRKEMEKKMMEERQKNTQLLNASTKGATAMGAIVLREEGKPPRELNHSEVVEMLTTQQKQLSQMVNLKELYGNSIRENIRLKEIVETQQKILDDKNVYISELETKIAETSEVIVIDVENQ